MVPSRLTLDLGRRGLGDSPPRSVQRSTRRAEASETHLSLCVINEERLLVSYLLAKQRTEIILVDG